MKYTNARSVFINKRGRYSSGEKVAIAYCTVLWILLITMPLLLVSPLNEGETLSYRLLNIHLIKSAILIFWAWILLIVWALSYRFKAFIHQTIGFKENESLFSLFLLIILTTAYIAIWDIAMLLKNNITYTMKLSDWYFFTAILLLIWIIYTLRRSVMHAKHLSKASVLKWVPKYSQDDEENFKQHIGNGDSGGLFE
jgi:hypothetical protein